MQYFKVEWFDLIPGFRDTEYSEENTYVFLLKRAGPKVALAFEEWKKNPKEPLQIGAYTVTKIRK